MVLGIGPPSSDASSSPEAVLGADHDGEEEQEAVSDATKSPVHITICFRSTTAHGLQP